MKKLDLTIRQGSTFKLPVLWETSTLVYKPVSAVARSAPVLVTTSESHGAPDGWLCALMNVKGMTELNAQNNPPKDSEFKPITFVDAVNLEFNTVNAAGYKPYVSGGQLVYYMPGDLLAITAVRMQIRNKVGGTVLAEFTLLGGDFALDLTRRRIVLTIPAADTAAFTFKSGVYDLEVEDDSGVVTPLLYGAVALTFEVTKPEI
jgi:hypothetical protein